MASQDRLGPVHLDGRRQEDLERDHDNRLVNRQLPATPGITAGPRPVPQLRMSQILSIELADERQFETVPEARVALSARNVTSSVSGLTFLLTLRGDDVELRLVSEWIE
jgi:hypothetical protein